MGDRVGEGEGERGGREDKGVVEVEEGEDGYDGRDG